MKWISRSRRASNNASASRPIHSLLTFAADMVLPSRITAGKHTPTGMEWSSSIPSWSTRATTVSMMPSGDPPSGVGILSRSDSSTPASTSTIAALMPVPPMSIPTARVMFVPLDSRKGEHVGATLGDDEGVLELRGDALVLGGDSPVIRPDVPLVRAQGEHRLDGEHHAHLHHGVELGGGVVVRDDQAGVERFADPVAGEVAHDPVAEAACV